MRYDQQVIDERTLVHGIIAGCVLIAIGLTPGLFQALVDGIRNFQNALRSSGMPVSQQSEPVNQPTWLAGAGAALITLTVLAYLFP